MLYTTNGWDVPPVLEVSIAYSWIFTAGLCLMTVAELAYGCWLLARRDRDALLFWLIVIGGFTVCWFCVEPFLDALGATTYPTNHLPYITIANHPLPILVPLTWGGGIGFSVIMFYRMIKRGYSARALIGAVLAFGVVEIMLEITSVHFGYMLYYSNNALVFGAPMPSIIQNGGWALVGAWSLVLLVPHLRGWRWAVVPFVAPMMYVAYAMVCTFPSYMAINTGVGSGLSYLLAAVSTVLNFLPVVAIAYSPTVTRYRAAAGHELATTAAETASDAHLTSCPAAQRITAAVPPA